MGLTLLPVVVAVTLAAVACGTDPNAEDANKTVAEEGATTEDERTTASSSGASRENATGLLREQTELEQGYLLERGSAGGDEVLFITQGPETSSDSPMMGTGGELVVDEEGCMRLETPGEMDDYLLLWPPGYEMETGGGGVRIVDREGHLVAEVGDEIGVGGGPRETDEPRVPEQCRSGPYWQIDQVGAHFVTYQVVALPNRETATFLRHSRSLSYRSLREGELSGELAVTDFASGSCIVVRPGGSADDDFYYVALWPPGHYARAQDGEVEILDGSGRVVARTGERVLLGGGKIPDDDAPKELQELPETSGCPGPYWIVR